jgi:hypothetical protein
MKEMGDNDGGDELYGFFTTGERERNSHLIF